MSDKSNQKTCVHCCKNEIKPENKYPFCEDCLKIKCHCPDCNVELSYVDLCDDGFCNSCSKQSGSAFSDDDGLYVICK